MMDIRSRLCLLVAGVILVAGSAFAQAPNQTPTPAALLDSNTPRTSQTAPAQSLREKLTRSGGVIHPQEVDPPSRSRHQGGTCCRRQGGGALGFRPGGGSCGDGDDGGRT
jgi:hypothetical protein